MSGITIIRAVGLGALVSMTSVFAADAPTLGVVHNTRENGWLNYDCNESNEGLLTCDITQVMVRKKLKPSELDAKYLEAIKGLDEKRDNPSMKDLCALASGAVDLIHGGPGMSLPQEARAVFQNLNEMQRQDIEQQFSALSETCHTKNMDGMRRFIRLGLEKDTRTCLVSTNRFEQTFRPVKDDDGKLLSWSIADTSPQGDCGFVQMSRFRPADPNGKTNTIFWQYVAKRATSNPEGRWLLGSCKDFEENETLYDWKAKEIPLQCDYIEQSPM